MPHDVLGRNFTARDSCVAQLLGSQKNQLHKHLLGKIWLGTSSVKKKPWGFELSAHLVCFKFNEMLGCIRGIMSSPVVN